MRGERGERPVPLIALPVGVCLGALAIVVDNIPAATALLVVASTGLSWGGAAAVAGASSPRPASAAISGLAVLIGAVATYYTGIGLFDTRGTADADLWAAGYTWGAVAAVAGPAIGLLGWAARHGTVPVRSVALGCAGGLLMSQGIYIGARIASEGLWSEPGPATLLAAALIAIPAAVVVLGARRASLPLALGAMALAGLTGAALWSLIVRAV